MKKNKIEQLKTLLANNLSGLVFFAEKPLVNDEVEKDDDLYYCIVKKRKIYKELRELRRTKALVWKETKTY